MRIASVIGGHVYRSPKGKAVACLIVLVLCFSAVPAIVTDQDDSDQLVRQVNLKVAEAPENVAKYSFVQVDLERIAQMADLYGRISLVLDGKEFLLALSPSAASDGRASSKCHLDDLVSCRQFEGSVEGIPDSSVRMSFADDGVYAWIKVPGNEWFLEPASNRQMNLGENIELVYSTKDLAFSGTIEWKGEHLTIPADPNASAQSRTQHESGDGVIQAEPLASSSPSAGVKAASGGTRVVPVSDWTQGMRRAMRLLAVTDNQFRAQHDDGYVDTLINTMNGWYTQVNVEVQIVNRISWSVNGNVDYETYINDLRNMVRNGGYTGYDQCVLFSGIIFNDDVIGVSWIRGCGTGLFGDSARTTWGFTLASCSNDYGGSQQHSETLAHELGHSLNGVHDQADPYPYRIENGVPVPPDDGTLMSYDMSPLHRFSDGTMNTWHNNAQRISSWASMNLHSVIWTQPGGASYHNVRLDNFKLRVRDVPGPNDVMENARWEFKNTALLSGRDLYAVWTAIELPWGAAGMFGVKYNIHIGANGRYYYDSGECSQTLAWYGQWRAYAAWWTGVPKDAVHYYKSSTVYVNRYHVLADEGVVDAQWGGFRVDVAGTMNQFAPGLMLWNFKILYLEAVLGRTTPAVGDTVDVYWGAFNTNDQPYQPATFQMYVACQSPSGAWKDFGTTAQTIWVQRSIDTLVGGFDDVNWLDGGNPGGGFCQMFKTSGKLDSTGTWRFIPDLYNGAYCPWYDAEAAINVG